MLLLNIGIFRCVVLFSVADRRAVVLLGSFKERCDRHGADDDEHDDEDFDDQAEPSVVECDLHVVPVYLIGFHSWLDRQLMLLHFDIVLDLVLYAAHFPNKTARSSFNLEHRQNCLDIGVASQCHVDVLKALLVQLLGNKAWIMSFFQLVCHLLVKLLFQSIDLLIVFLNLLIGLESLVWSKLSGSYPIVELLDLLLTVFHPIQEKML